MPIPEADPGPERPPEMFVPGAVRLLKGLRWLLNPPGWLLNPPGWLLNGLFWLFGGLLWLTGVMFSLFATLGPSPDLTWIPGPFCGLAFGSELLGADGLDD